MKSSHRSAVGRSTARALAELHRLRHAPLTWPIVSGLVLMVAIAIGTALAILRFREDAIANGRDGLTSAVLLLAQHFERQFQDFAVLQNSLAEDFESHGFESVDRFRGEMSTLAVHEMLRVRATGWNDVAGVNVFDARGVLINSSKGWPVGDVRISDRRYFDRLKHDPTLRQELEAVTSRFSPATVIVLARRISGPHGEFLGVLTRAITSEELETFFASTGLGPDASISIHHVDGQLLARYPHVSGMIGQNFKKGPIEQQAVFTRPYLTTRLKSPIDGKDRIIASRLLASVPLVVVATRTLDSTLITWRAQTKFFVGAAVVFILLIVATLHLIFRQMTRQLLVEKQRLDIAVNHMAQGLLLFDSSERLIVCNRRYIDMYGLSPERAKPGCTLLELLRHRQETGSFQGDVEAYRENILTDARRSQSFVVESSVGRLVEIRHEPVASGGWVATHEDVTERIRAQERIAHLAHYDVLTDLPNRMMLHNELQRRIADLAHGNPFAVLYIDIDEFKTINDTMGHEVGDELLRQIAGRLRSCVGPQDLVARLGGDEFAIVKGGGLDKQELEAFAEHVLETLRASLNCKGQEVPIAASIGIALAPEHGRELDELLKSADLAMYAAKADGRRTYRFFVPEMDARLKKRHEMERDLHEALARDQFEVHYQPLVDLATDAISGFEALIRWRHPVRGMISPAEFIPVAEDTGLINEIGEWVLKRACAEAAGWPTQIKIAVNISPIQFRSKTLPLRVAAVLSETGLPADRLELEITEAVLIRDDVEALTILHQLRALGVRIALDDFGTGYSSLSYLRRFPFDKIKIDRSFVNDIGDQDGSSTIVQAVVSMAAACQMSTTAEGVETELQRGVLKALGCSQMQGYLFSPAVPAEKLQELLSRPAAAA